MQDVLILNLESNTKVVSLVCANYDGPCSVSKFHGGSIAVLPNEHEAARVADWINSSEQADIFIEETDALPTHDSAEHWLEPAH